MNEIEIKNKILNIEKAIEIFTTDENITDTEKTLSLKVLEKRKSLLNKKLDITLGFPPQPPTLHINNINKTPTITHKSDDVNIKHYIENVIL